MKMGLIGLALVGMMVSSACVAAEGAPKHEANAKPRTEWKGDLSVAPTNAAADVVAVLSVKRGDVVKTYNLTSADAEVVAKIKEGATKGTTVVVKGELNKDETAIAVTKCTEAAKSTDKPKGAHHEKTQK